MQGFAKNLKFLKKVFDPSYDILDMRAVSATDFEARWSMGFELQLVQKTPLRKYWQPKLSFTGITYYGTNAETGLIDQHLDYWDNIDNQKYFSFEAFGDVLRQMFSVQRTPDLQSPGFMLLKCVALLLPAFRCCPRGALVTLAAVVGIPLQQDDHN